MKKIRTLIVATLLVNVNTSAQQANSIYKDNNHSTLSELNLSEIPVQSLYSLKTIMTLNSQDYFKDYIDSKYDSKLKKDIFIRSEGFKILQDSLAKIKNTLLGSYYIINIKSKDDYNHSEAFKKIEQYDIDRKIKSVVIGESVIVQGSKKQHLPNVFGSYYFPNLAYSISNTTSTGSLVYLHENRYINIPMSIEKALEYDEKRIEAYVVYKFEGLTANEKIKSTETKLFLTIGNSIIYEEENKPKRIVENSNFPFVGVRKVDYTNERTIYIFKIDKLGNCEIAVQNSNKTIIMYKGKYHNRIITKDGGFQFDLDEVTFLTKEGAIQTGCIDLNDENLDEKPCVFKLSTGELK